MESTVPGTVYTICSSLPVYKLFGGFWAISILTRTVFSQKLSHIPTKIMTVFLCVLPQVNCATSCLTGAR